MLPNGGEFIGYRMLDCRRLFGGVRCGFKCIGGPVRATVRAIVWARLNHLSSNVATSNEF